MGDAENLKEIEKLKRQIKRLEKELEEQKAPKVKNEPQSVVTVPEKFKEIFEKAEENVAEYYAEGEYRPDTAEIIYNGERYILMRSAAISFEFLDVFKEFYPNKSEEEATRIGNNFLFDIAHVLGKEDALQFHKKTKVQDPLEKLSAGPVQFAYMGWANVEVLSESNPTPDDNFFLKYYHHNSFEAQTWINAKRESNAPVCIMNSGYSSGWCEESFGMPLTAVEIACEAQGADHCTFIMAPPDKIKQYLEEEETVMDTAEYDIPVFFERKYTEDKLRESLRQKETLLREVHHRVKNNLQVVSSLLNLQYSNIEDEGLQNQLTSTIMRVNTMARIHEMIYGNRDLNSIHMEKYFGKLMRSLAQIYGSELDQVEVEIDVEVDDLFLFPEKAIPLGLILNEIATNSFKYAFEKEGTFYLKMNESDDEKEYVLIVGDNGRGLSDDHNKSSLGLSLIEILCEQIDAELEVKNGKTGLEYQIRFAK